jgi:hypothetical protein
MVNKTDDVFARLYELSGVKNDAGLAKVLNVTPQAIANTRKRNGIPYEKICSYAEEHGFSVDYILLGIDQTAETNKPDIYDSQISLKNMSRINDMARLLHFIFKEFNKDFFLKEQLEDEDTFWLITQVYRNVLIHLPSNVTSGSDKAFDLACHFVKVEVEHYTQMIELARRNTERKKH